MSEFDCRGGEDAKHLLQHVYKNQVLGKSADGVDDFIRAAMRRSGTQCEQSCPSGIYIAGVLRHCLRDFGECDFGECWPDEALGVDPKEVENYVSALLWESKSGGYRNGGIRTDVMRLRAKRDRVGILATAGRLAKFQGLVIFRGWGSTCRRGLVGEYVCVSSRLR